MRRVLTRAAWAVATVAILAAAVAATRSDGEGQEPQAVADSATPVPVPPVATAPPWNPEQVDAAARTLPRLHSLLVSRRGELIFERYYNGARARPARPTSSRRRRASSRRSSASRIDRKLIPDVKTPIVTYFPELAQDPDARKRAITVEHLLMMRPGLEGTSNRNYGAWVTSRNWVRHALARPMFAAPGEEMEYSTGNTHLLSAILTKATGKSTWQFANEVLAKPLGFSLPQWPRDPQGIYFGGNDMLMTPRQMLAFGELYLNEGRVNGQQIVLPSALGASSRARGGRATGGRAIRRPNADGFVDPMRDRQYGYGWWVYEIGGDRHLLRVGLRRAVHLRLAGSSISSSSRPRHPTSARSAAAIAASSSTSSSSSSSRRSPPSN